LKGINKMKIDEELWKSAHLELIHDELERRWKRKKRQHVRNKWESYFENQRRMRKEEREKEIIQDCRKWPKVLRRAWYKWMGYDLKEIGVYGQ